MPVDCRARIVPIDADPIFAELASNLVLDRDLYARLSSASSQELCKQTLLLGVGVGDPTRGTPVLERPVGCWKGRPEWGTKAIRDFPQQTHRCVLVAYWSTDASMLAEGLRATIMIMLLAKRSGSQRRNWRLNRSAPPKYACSR